MVKRKQPPTSLELLEKFKKKCPNLDPEIYTHVHNSIIEARITVTLAAAEMRLENEKANEN